MKQTDVYTLATVIAFLVSSLAFAQRATTPLSGSWQGEITIPGSPLPIAITFSEEGALSGSIDIPVQGIDDLPLSDLKRDGQTVSFGLGGISGNPRFEGTLKGTGEAAQLSGNFTQSGQSFPFSLTPREIAMQRPQEPQPPYPYRSEEVTLENGEIPLAGTLTLPEGNGPFPAVQLISGSGPQNRDSALAGHKPFLLLADTLTRAGYAVLRFDDRGVGGSSGDLSQADYDDLVSDILAGVDFLKSRPDITPDKIGLLGASEGGYLAPLAAQRSSDIAFVILAAGPAVPGDEVLLEQNRLIYEQAGAPEEIVEAQLDFIRTFTSQLKAEDYEAARQTVRANIEAQFAALPEAQRPEPAALEETIAAQVEASVSPYFRAFAVYDPRAALEALSVPVLALYGGKDVQVTAAQNEGVMRERLTDNPDATVRTFPDLNHLMQPAQTGSVDEYAQIETTFAPAALKAITDWLEARF